MSTSAAAVKTAPKSSPAGEQPIERLGPFELFDEIYNRIAGRAFAIFQANGRNFGHELDDWLQAEAQLLHPVHLQVRDGGDAITVEAEVPGFAPDDLAIGLEGRRLTILGKRETQEEPRKERAVYQERCSNEILRVLDLPSDVAGEQAKAALKNGILELALPKSACASTKRMEIRIS